MHQPCPTRTPEPAAILPTHPPACPPPGCCRTLWERDLITEELDTLMHGFDGIAKVGAHRTAA